MAQPTQRPESSRELDRILEFLLPHWSTGRSPPPPGPNTASPFTPTLDDIEEFLVEREVVYPKASLSLLSQEEKLRADKALQVSVDLPSSCPNQQPHHGVVASSLATTQSHPCQTLPTILSPVAADPAGPGLALSLPTLSPGSTWLLVPLSVPIQSPSRASAGPKHRERSQRCPVPGCGKAYGRASHLQAHLRCHTGERPFACGWQGCQRRFARSDELSRHCRAHSGQRPHTCPSCPARFARRDHLIKHARSHREQSLYKDFNECVHTGGPAHRLHLNGDDDTNITRNL